MRGWPIGWPRGPAAPTSARCPPAVRRAAHVSSSTFVIMLPITIKTGDPMKGWSAGLVWVFFQSFILMIGGFHRADHSKNHPGAPRCSARLPAFSVTFISMRPALEMYMTPQIGLVCFGHHPGKLVRRHQVITRESPPAWSRSRSA